MNDDDDLPILTHVLRTGMAPVTAPSAVAPSDMDEDPDDVFSVGPLEPVRLDLSIGSVTEAAAVVGGERTTEAVPAFPERSARSDIVADPRRTLVRDAFGPLDGEVDDLEFPGTIEPIDEPHLPAPAPDDGIARVALDRPFDFSAPPDTTALARSIRQAVLDDLASRIDTELDARIAQAMRSEVEVALSRLQENLRSHLTDALRDVVARAVDAEIARMRWSASTGRPH